VEPEVEAGAGVSCLPKMLAMGGVSRMMLSAVVFVSDYLTEKTDDGQTDVSALISVEVLQGHRGSVGGLFSAMLI